MAHIFSPVPANHRTVVTSIRQTIRRGLEAQLVHLKFLEIESFASGITVLSVPGLCKKGTKHFPHPQQHIVCTSNFT
jgi:hypothetical protein